jgi:hypothetical protein
MALICLEIHVRIVLSVRSRIMEEILMQYKASSVEEYLEVIPDERKDKLNQLRKVILTNLPKGFEEDFEYGMISYVVPLSRYEKGYHAKANTPLPFVSLASQKHTINLYHSGIYADERLFTWFNQRYQELFSKKPDMGKSCIRFKEVNDLVLKIVGELLQKMTVDEYIKLYEERLEK